MIAEEPVDNNKLLSSNTIHPANSYRRQFPILLVSFITLFVGGAAAEPGLLPHAGAGKHRQQRPQGRGKRHGRLQDAYSSQVHFKLTRYMPFLYVFFLINFIYFYIPSLKSRCLKVSREHYDLSWFYFISHDFGLFFDTRIMIQIRIRNTGFQSRLQCTADASCHKTNIYVK